MSDQSPTDASARIDLEVPARTEFASTVRLIAASLGADSGFTIDEIDDLRLGLNEIFACLADDERVERVSMSFLLGVGSLSVTVGSPELNEAIELDELAATILRSVVDDIARSGGTIRVVKTAAEVAASGFQS
ncbi:MAG: hypothetical protein R2715_02475 [Ilumatobacteraceae bacterium]